MVPPPPPSVELLIEHHAFLRGLSRSLVVDEQRAEDVVQETYLAVLKRPPPPHVRLKAWLGAIARNLALRSRRTEARVHRREARGAKPEALEATVDVTARVESQQRVVAAVAALPEHARRAIVWRYFDGLTPSEIARREDVSVRTIESRLRRARETLRASLDTTYGTRAVWQAALLPVAGWSAAAGASWTSAAASGAQGSAPTASTAGTAVAVGATVMNIKMALGIGAACVAGAFFAGRQLAPPAEELRADDPHVSSEGQGPVLGAESAQRLKLEAELASERERNEALTREVAALKQKIAPVGEAVEAGAAVATKEADARAAYGPEAYVKVVSAVDWAVAGEAVTKLVPLLAKLELAFREGADMSPKEVAGISRWNSPLAQMALSVQESNVPGTGTPGVFSHPAVAVNLITSALAQADVPLSEAQSIMLAELGDRFIVDDQRRLAGYNEDSLSLERTIEEVALKDRFYAGADALLTEAQRDVLHPPSVRGRVGVDLFSTGVIWHPLTKPVRFTGRADLGPRMAAVLMAQLEIPAEQRELIEDAAATWARAFTDAELKFADDPVLRDSGKMTGGLVAGWAKFELVRAAARNMLALDRQLLAGLPADSSAAQKIRKGAPYIAVPVKK